MLCSFFYPGIFCVTKLILSFVEWSDENPPASNILRLIYQGRFLHGNVTLGGNSSHHYMPWWQVLFVESFAKILMQSVLYDVLACFFLVREKSVRGIDRFERISTFFSVIMSVVKMQCTCDLIKSWGDIRYQSLYLLLWIVGIPHQKLTSLTNDKAQPLFITGTCKCIHWITSQRTFKNLIILDHFDPKNFNINDFTESQTHEVDF